MHGHPQIVFFGLISLKESIYIVRVRLLKVKPTLDSSRFLLRLRFNDTPCLLKNLLLVASVCFNSLSKVFQLFVLDYLRDGQRLLIKVNYNIRAQLRIVEKQLVGRAH